MASMVPSSDSAHSKVNFVLTNNSQHPKLGSKRAGAGIVGLNPIHDRGSGNAPLQSVDFLGPNIALHKGGAIVCQPSPCGTELNEGPADVVKIHHLLNLAVRDSHAHQD